MLPFVIVGTVAVFVVAAVLIGREASRLGGQAPRPVFDVDEAVLWIADRLPPDVTAQLSHDDVRFLLLSSLERLELDQDEVVDDDELLAHVLGQATAAEHEITPRQAQAVLDVEAAYLEVIGAAGALKLPPDPDG